ncbi:MAG: strawberry notch family protein [Oculatellaceae cyanobacterium Prado106]|jgi:hypothetical protein|nr:strawberry notch family protein [Oculatellaceae cyanobacterium Prado106]
MVNARPINLLDVQQLAIFDVQASLTRPYEVNLFAVAQRITTQLLSGHKIHANHLRTWMNQEFNGTDAEGVWNWKDAYEAQEVALVMLLKLKGKTFLGQPALSHLHRLVQIEQLTLTQTKRTKESVELQQFSTPLPLAYLVACCAQMAARDIVLEPSAGTGILAQFAANQGSPLILNEWSDRRLTLLRKLFPGQPLHSFNAEQIHDYLPQESAPTVVLMNPPFSASPNIQKRYPTATVKHIRSAFLRLVSGGRLVMITAHWFEPASKAWKATFRGLDVDIRLTVHLAGSIYAKHGTRIETRLTIIDKQAASGSEYPDFKLEDWSDAAIKTLLKAIPARRRLCSNRRSPQASIAPSERSPQAPTAPSERSPHLPSPPASQPERPEPSIASPEEAIAVDYEILESLPDATQFADTLYEVYQPRRLHIPGSRPHPTTLCESVALASVSPPIPQYRPHLPQRVLSEGLLSEAQLESLIYAGEAHAHHLRGYYQVDAQFDHLSAVAAGNGHAFRRGWFLGDGTGAGKGRQIAGIILDNFLKGRTKAIWISKSDKLVEDARRDWCALGGHESDIVALSKYKLGQPIELSQGILFTTYATLRTGEKKGKPSRLQQILTWVGTEFEGVLAFDESHAMGNAIAEQGKLGVKPPAQQAIAGLRLQNALPQARVLYVSATAATRVSHLAYASRLGLWQTGDFPFADRVTFIEAIEAGGVAAMEVVCRDLKALGLYFARNLSFEGVEYEALEVELTPDQIEIYNRYAGAFQMIHAHLDEALAACNITQSSGKTLNGQAKAAAKSLFESQKQRFFNHLITSMKCPTLLRAIAQDLASERAVVVQIVSTNEEILKRRLAEVSTEEWTDLNIDVTPREYVMSYLKKAFPVQLYAVHSDEKGHEYSEAVRDAEGNPVLSQEAIALRDEMIEHLGSQPPLPGALEQILHTFGADEVAEVTGRSLRIFKDPETSRLYASQRPGSANLAETQAFLDGQKRILIFSDAGGTGRSYHADLGCLNQRRRVHYLLEAGWRADNAIQGLGRSHRTNQVTAPIFRPVVTTVRGERRFISTIARRLDTLGALTKGQRQTGGQGLFDPKDNLESVYAEAALEQLLDLIYRGEVACCSLAQFEQATGLMLQTQEGGMREDLPEIPRFLNRLLALPIQLQNDLFEVFEQLLAAKVEGAIAAGTYEVGVETLQAERFAVRSREVIYTHPTGGQTLCLEIERTQRRQLLSSDQASRRYRIAEAAYLVNGRSQRAAIRIPTDSTISDTGAVVSRVSLIRPTEKTKLTLTDLAQTSWQVVAFEEWQHRWNEEVAETSPWVSDRFYLITGLLLPIWEKISSHSVRVYRLETDNGERLLGRMVDVAQMAKLAAVLGLNQVQLSAQEIYEWVLGQRQSYSLSGGLALRPSSIMGTTRLEVTGTIAEGLGQQLKAAGCFTEVISWRTRYFIPIHERVAPGVIEQVMSLIL